MKIQIIRLFAVLLFALPTPVLAAQHKLPSGGVIDVPLDSEVITDQAGLDATMTEVSGKPDPDVEGIWFSDDGGVYYESHEEGYVSLDDWGDMDADALLESYIEGTKEQSKLMGHKVEVLGWAIPPTLSKNKAIAYYSLKLKFGEEEPLVNLVIYKFGRYGYEEITLVAGADAVSDSEAERVALKVASSFDFGKDASYADYRDGDKVAAVGAAGLLAAVFGSKLAKTGLFVMLAAFAKKGWFLIFIPLIFGWRIIKEKLFGP
ncbi:DUF2167 domain-containing protein [Kiloniella sp.]|uniref:DUF2167 domain-containing protein n=1 Tax=Kiloniella sp. TaxID=1938587 RepID=UPI003B01BA8C